MSKCKTCGKKFHACSNCYLTNEWEYEYCSTNCYNKSTESKYATLRADIKKALDKFEEALEEAKDEQEED